MTQAQMTCPIDGAQLVMSERQGVEIDYCPSCRGVWLDRGELDKILERSAAEFARAAPPPTANPAGYSHDPGYGRHPRYGDDYRHRKRKKSFLEELFD
jgi:Zn-finger nucleic acid-binding protein